MVEPVALGYRVERRARDRVEQLAENAEVSGAVMLEFLIENFEVTSRGLPKGWPEPEKDGELDIEVT